MAWPAIRKTAWPNSVIPNVVDYGDAVADFSWNKARRQLDGLPNGRGLNIAHEAVDRPEAAAPFIAHVLREVGRQGGLRYHGRRHGRLLRAC